MFTVRDRRGSVGHAPTPGPKDGGNYLPTLQETINIKLIESGKKERLNELLRERLIECGWIDEMRGLCRYHWHLKEFRRKEEGLT